MCTLEALLGPQSMQNVSFVDQSNTCSNSAMLLPAFEVQVGFRDLRFGLTVYGFGPTPWTLNPEP